MPYHRRRDRQDARRRWETALPSVLERVRFRLGAIDLTVPDDVLLAEAAELFEPPDLWPAEQWFVQRLTGTGNTAAEREALAASIRERARTRASQSVPWGLLRWPKGSGRPRRGAPPR